MIQKIPEGLDFSNGSRFLKTENIFFAEYQQTIPQYPRHIFLSAHTLIFVVHGAKLFTFANHTLEVGEGHAILLKRGCYMICEGLEKENKYSSISLFFNERLLKDFWLNNAQFFQKEKDIPNDPVIVISENELLTNFRNTILGYFNYKGPCLESLIKNKLEELLLLMLETPEQGKIAQFFHEIYAQSKPDIEYVVSQNIFTPLSVEELARLSVRSLSAFKKEFQEIFHQPPKKWITEKRLDHARVLLQHSSKTVSEIGFDCGFESPSHFIRLFKKHFGYTPNTQRN